MKKEVKKRFQEMILDVVQNLSLYPSPYYSDTTIIAQEVARKYRRELIEMGLLSPQESYWHARSVVDGWWIHDKVLRQLNNLHKEGKIAKRMDYGGEGKGRNYTFIRWGRRAKYLDRRSP
ncbi:MAG: hypothetical protein JRD89_01220 [Deltaproteobacteria bacterium]|nr:hypothetical protein [Deltaproteobacteria bacterium]